MAVISAAAAALRSEVEAAALMEATRVGIERFNRSVVVKPFLGRGSSQSTIYRWVDAALATGKVGQAMVRGIKAAADARVAPRKHDTPSASAEKSAAALADLLPAIATLEDVAGIRHPIPVIQTLGEIVDDVKLLIAHAKTTDGEVRNSRLLLAASGELRKCLETAVKLLEAMREVDQVDRLHAAIIKRVAELAPETAAAILRDIDQIAAQWTGA
jgi:hypothetical protein